MENQIKVFENAEFGNVRTICDDRGDVWFVAKDVASILGYQNLNEAIIDHVDIDDKLNSKSLSSLDINLGQRGGWLINESGLYSLVLSSKMPGAKAFKRWVTCDVLPTIRKTVSALETIEYKGNVDGLVYAKDGVATTTSVNIAKVFEMSHRNILQAIDAKLNSSNKRTADFSTDHIHAVEYLDSQNKIQRQYELDEQGFSFIALGLTGEKADAFKIQYIDAFSKMKDALQNMFKARLVESVLPQDNRNRQYIYILKNPLNETIKIGVAQDVEKRIQQLQTGAGVELELVYKSLVCSNAFSVERDVHAHFDNKRTFGEWFKVSVNEAVEFLEKQTFVLKSEFAKYIGVGVK